MPPPEAPFHQVGHTLEFDIVWDTIAGLSGGAVLQDFCAGHPGECSENGRACTKQRLYASVSLKYHVNLKLNCDKSDDKISYWDVLGVYLAGPPKDKHHTKEFKTNKLTGTVYNGEIHMFKVSDVDRDLLEELFDKIAFDKATAKLRLAAVDKMVTQTTWHERQHEAFMHKHLAARETILNDPHYPAQVHGPTGTSLKVMRETVINYVKSDLKKRLLKAKTAEKACHADLHAWLAKPDNYERVLARCVCGAKAEGNKTSKEVNKDKCEAVAAGVGGGPPKKPHPCDIPTE